MLKKIALLVVMFALPLGAMAQAKFAHMNSQDVIAVMPEFTKAQADLDAMSKKYQDEMQRTNEEFQKKYQELPGTSRLSAEKHCRKTSERAAGYGSTPRAVPTRSLSKYAESTARCYGSHLSETGRSHPGCRQGSKGVGLVSSTWTRTPDTIRRSTETLM